MPACSASFNKGAHRTLTLTDQDRRKLFVGLTRAQLRVELVLSAQAVQALMGVVG